MKPKHLSFTEAAVTKHFTSAAAFFAELQAYRLGLPMLPALLDYLEPEWITLQKVPGTHYLDSSFSFDAALLASTLASFHLFTAQGNKCLCHWDNQPHNILFTEGKYWFVDFSDSRYYYPEADITHLLLFWAADMPTDVFKPLVLEFMESYQATNMLNPHRWQTCYNESCKRFDERRAQYNKPLGTNPPEVIQANRMILLSNEVTK